MFLTKKQDLVFLFGIFFVAVFWRLYKLNIIPAGLNLYEHNLLVEAIKLSKNWRIVPTGIDHAIYTYLLAGVGYLANFGTLYMRLLQVGIGFLMVVLFYLFVKDWFNRQTAFLATLLFSTSSFVVLMSRNLQPEILIPVLILSILYLGTIALRKKILWLFALIGILTGALLYTDPVFVILPILIIGFITFAYFKFPENLTENWRKYSLMAVFFLIAAVPYFFYLPQNIQSYLSQINPGSIGGYYLNLGANVQSLVFLSPVNLLFNVGAEPILDPFVSISFICGLVYAVFFLKRRKFLFLVSWFTLAFFAISLKTTQTAASFLVLMPVVYALSAIMLDYILTHWVRTFPYNRAARLMMTFVFSLFLFLSVFYNYQKYFWAWGKNVNIQENYKYNIEYQKK